MNVLPPIWTSHDVQEKKQHRWWRRVHWRKGNSTPCCEWQMITLLMLSFSLTMGTFVRAFGAINYAHAWIDAGVKIGWLDGHEDDVLFTLP